MLKAKQAGDFSARTLSGYQELLNTSFVMQDFKNFKDSLQVLENPRFFQYYPGLVGEVMRDLYQIPAGPKDRLYPSIKKYLGFKEIWAMGKRYCLISMMLRA